MGFLRKLFILSVGLFLVVACGHREHREHRDAVLIYQCQGNVCQCQTPPQAPYYPRPTPLPYPEYPRQDQDQDQDQKQDQAQNQAGKVVVVVNSSSTSNSSSNSKSVSKSCNTNYNLLTNNRFERKTKCKNKPSCLSFGNWEYSEFEKGDINLEYDLNSCDNIESETIEN